MYGLSAKSSVSRLNIFGLLIRCSDTLTRTHDFEKEFFIFFFMSVSNFKHDWEIFLNFMAFSQYVFKLYCLNDKKYRCIEIRMLREVFNPLCVSGIYSIDIIPKNCLMECWIKDSITLKFQNEYDNIDTRTRSPVGRYQSNQA